MLNLAPLRYRNVLAEDGGPIAHVETGRFPVRGQHIFLANVRLVPGCTRRGPRMLFGDADGTGTDRVASVARHKAVSEAMERWAFHSLVKSERAEEFGFDLDPTTTGMSAFPGMLRRQARRSSVLEAVERYCLCAWWDGHMTARAIETDWPGVSALALEGPFGGVTVIVYAHTPWGGYVYGHAAEESFGAACEHAVVELARHEWVLRSAWLASVAGERMAPSNILERRCLFFASEEGHEVFQEHARARSGGKPPPVEVICDAHLPGPWEDYASVWRFALRPPSEGYLRGGERYFFL